MNPSRSTRSPGSATGGRPIVPAGRPSAWRQASAARAQSMASTWSGRVTGASQREAASRRADTHTAEEVAGVAQAGPDEVDVGRGLPALGGRALSPELEEDVAGVGLEDGPLAVRD